MEETKIKGLKNKIRFTGVLATIAGWVIVVGYAALVIAKYAKLPAVENIVLSIDVIAASVTIGIGVLYICLGNQIKRMESIHLRNDIQILFLRIFDFNGAHNRRRELAGIAFGFAYCEFGVCGKRRGRADERRRI